MYSQGQVQLAYALSARRILNICSTCTANLGVCATQGYFYCSCPPQRFGLDCEIMLIQNSFTSKAYLETQPGNWSQVEYLISTSDGDYDCLINQIDRVDIGVSFFVQGHDRGTRPNFKTNFFVIPAGSSRNDFTIYQNFVTQALQNQSTGLLILGVYNLAQQSGLVQIDFTII